MTAPVDRANGQAPTTGANPVGDVVDGVTAVGQQLRAAGVWMSNRHNWVRVGWFMTGYVLFLAGGYLISRPVTTPVVAGVKSATTKAAKLVV